MNKAYGRNIAVVQTALIRENAMGEKTSKKNVKKPSKSIKEKRAEKRGAAAAADSIVIPKK